jgi:hypothetical protein
MALAPAFNGDIDDTGKLRVCGVDRFKAYLKTLAGARVRIVVSRAKKDRSLSQNSYYHGVIVYRLAMEFGYDEPSMHEALKWQFLRVEDRGPIPTVRSTTDLSTVEFEDYLSRIREWASMEFGIVLPLPNEVEIA